MRVCTNPLFRTLQPKFEAKAKRNPLKVLEAEHGFEAVVPGGGEEAEVDGIGIVLQNEFRGEPAILKPDWPPIHSCYHTLAIPVHTLAVLIAKGPPTTPQGVSKCLVATA